MGPDRWQIDKDRLDSGNLRHHAHPLLAPG
jgi:hypothetical protein